MSKSSSPCGCIWHMDRVGQTSGHFMSVWPVASRTRVYTSSRRLRRWRKSVEAAPPGWPTTWLGWPATTWRKTGFSKSMKLPHDPINIPYSGNEYTPHFGDSTCKALILSVIARRSLVRRVMRLWGPEGLTGTLLVDRVQKLCRNPSGSDRVSQL
jgi:hypothetical protein